ncbi:MAG: hypothetical protein UW09_C0001G0267 [candidate division TM6 bacterium GW2011_GWF2_43_87]|nr:MAG: hypothetical protein UW09_C0001G0267 [candidate division TM6 bacterium GW2011_GWF2_43_87]
MEVNAPGVEKKWCFATLSFNVNRFYLKMSFS